MHLNNHLAGTGWQERVFLFCQLSGKRRFVQRPSTLKSSNLKRRLETLAMMVSILKRWGQRTIRSNAVGKEKSIGSLYTLYRKLLL